MFGWEFPPHISGGLGTACYGLTRGLAHNGVEVALVVPKAYGDEDQSAVRIVNASEFAFDARQIRQHVFNEEISFIEVNSQMIPYIGLDEYYNVINQLESGTFSTEESAGKHKFAFQGGYGADLMKEVEKYALVAAEIAQSQEYDVIHAHDWLTYRAGIAAKRVSGRPLVVHIHATEYDRSGEHNRNDIVYNLEREGMMAADAVCAVSNLTRNIVIEKYGIPAEKVYTLHNAVEPALRQTDGKRPLKEKIVTFLGRVTFQKGPEYYVEAAKRVLDRDPDVRFVLAGDGDMMPRVIKRVAELGISDKFHFTGFLRGKDIDRMFGMSDVYVMPSISEPFGISPLEAMQSGVPVVISKQSGVSEVLQYAIKVDFWDIDAMADAIYGILHYPSLARVFSEKGCEEANNLKWEDVAARLKTIYEKCVFTQSPLF